ncbi:DUF6119 family protein [Mucilaginibacter sp. BT774]|uniref:DUF6119 family protein n=1 Tax=Mucilaginibacter sp. BT774 TaxID=3062276 RepID=UPI00267536B8|nr:DUF6119 family protein [Mucilaginibacter sp. BT774]MDO3627649.1 TIGR04141 family sporadically distributed protein [Mucilaginibacter sp. BT774]
MSDRIQNSFYLLKEQVIEFKEASGKRTQKQIDLPYLKKRFKNKGYKEQKLKPVTYKDYDISLFYRRKPSAVKWKDFIATIADPDADILKYPDAIAESFILILISKVTNKFFAVTGGFGHIDIQEVATTDLGIEILSRIVKKEDKALRATKEQSFTGGVQGAIKFFRNDYNLNDNESFGVIYQELTASIDKSKLVNMFGFSIEDLRSNSTCIAKNSFSLKKSLNFKELLRVISACEKILKNSPIVQINAVTKVNKNKTALINSLNATIDQNVFAVYQKPTSSYSIEIGHKDFEKYFQAQRTTITFWYARKLHSESFDDPIRDIQSLVSVFRDKLPTLSKEDFDKVIDRGIIRTEDADGNLLTNDFIRDHYCTEIRHAGKSYFLIEKDWYEISVTMIDSINQTCTGFVKDRQYQGPQVNKWRATHTDENKYNASYIGQPNSLVFDKITPSNIEVCDIVRWDKDNIYLYHVKQGFDNSMRDLCNQVFISARKVIEDSKIKFDFVGQLYDKLANNNGNSPYIKKAKKQLQTITRQQFIDLFIARKIVFVLAVMDTSRAGTRTLLGNMTDFESNIAKFSLNELTKSMRNLDATFQVLQLSK